MKTIRSENGMEEYIQVNEELYFEECKGRYTTILPGSRGILLTEKIINRLHITEQQKETLRHKLDCAAGNDEHRLALVNGYVCRLNVEDYEVKPLTPDIFIVGEII